MKAKINTDISMEDSLVNTDRWVLWKVDERGDKETKVPVDGTGNLVDPMAEDNWMSYKKAKEWQKKMGHYVGFVFDESDDIIGIDLDDVRDKDTGELVDWAKDVVLKVDALWEISPSGTGLHGYCRADLEEDSYQLLEDTQEYEGHLEIYQNSRFFTFTADFFKDVADFEQEETEVIEDYVSQFEKVGGSEEEQHADEKDELDLDIDCHDVVFAADAPVGERVSHPYHSSSSNANFMIDEDKETWRCWRHNITGNALHLIGMEEGVISCGDWDGSGLSNEQWSHILQIAEEKYGIELEEEDEDEGENRLNTRIRERNGRYYIIKGEDEEELTSFQMEVENVLVDDEDGKMATIRVIPAHDEEEYEVTVSPDAFNRVRDFKKKICTGLMTTFSGSSNDLNELRLHVLSKNKPTRKRVRAVGLYEDEIVLPDRVLRIDEEEPKHQFHAKNNTFNGKFPVNLEDEPDKEEVKEILERIGDIRPSERWLPVLSYYYAAFFTPYIRDIEGEVPFVTITGNTGSGKTTSLEVPHKAFGMDGDNFSAGSTPHGILNMLSGSKSIPVWLDEYKPSQIDDYKLDSLHNYIRKATKKGIETKGNKDMSVTKYVVQSPLILSGEEGLSGAAEKRRQIHVTFKKSTTTSVGYSRKFAELVGDSWKDEQGDTHYEDGLDLSEHAKAFYRYVLELDKKWFEKTWRASKEFVMEILSERNIQVKNMDLTKLAMVRQGIRVYRHFADQYDAELGLSEEDIEEILVYLAENSTDNYREDHVDTFIRLLGLADTTDSTRYLSMHSDDDPEIHISLDEAYADVRQYMRNNDVGSAYEVLQSPDDYRERLKDMADGDGSYVLDTSKVDNKLNRCVALYAEGVAEEIYDGDFEEVKERF